MRDTACVSTGRHDDHVARLDDDLLCFFGGHEVADGDGLVRLEVVDPADSGYVDEDASADEVVDRGHDAVTERATVAAYVGG